MPNLNKINSTRQTQFSPVNGYKILHGYLQVAGLFFADKMVCLFERSNALIEVPKMEISLDDVVYQKVHKHLKFFRQFAIRDAWYINRNPNDQNDDKGEQYFATIKRYLGDNKDIFGEETRSNGLSLPDDLVQDITFTTDDGIVELTPWGRICWQKAKEKIYQEEVLWSPSPLLSFSEEFEDSAQKICRTPAMRKAFNMFVDRYVIYLHDSRNNPTNIITKPLHSKPENSISTYEIDVNLDDNIFRILLHKDKEKEKTVFDAII